MKLKKLISFVAIIGSILYLGVGLNGAYATGSATLSLSPASGSYNINTNFTVVIYENSGSESVNAVEADLNYDQAKLQFVSINAASSAFDTSYQASGGAGSVKIARANNSGSRTGSQIVADVTFKALVGSGSSAVTFANSSAIVRTSDSANIWNGSSAGGTYSFTTPTAPPPSAPASNSTSTSTTTTSSSSSTSSASNPANNSSSGSSPSSNTTSNPTANPSAPANSNTTTAVPANGTMVAIKVVDASGQPVEGAKVVVGNQQATTDKTGIASFLNVPVGRHTATATSKGLTAKSDITVTDKTAPGVQQFEIKLVRSKGLPWPIWFIPPAIALLVGLFIVVRWLPKRNAKLIKDPMVMASAPVIPPTNGPLPTQLEVAQTPPQDSSNVMIPRIYYPDTHVTNQEGGGLQPH